MSIQKFLDKIKNGRYGVDITEAIIGGIKKCYDDASVNHDNANMEVKMARGTHDTLNDRLVKSEQKLDETNAQLSQKASEKALAVERARIDSFTKLNEGSTTGDAELIDARVGADGIVYQNLGEAIRKQIDNNITPYINLPFELIPDYYINYKTGEQYAYTQILGIYFASDFIKLISNESINIKNLNYTGSDSAGLAFYTEDEKFISGYQYNNETDLTVEVPTNAVYVRFTLKKHDYSNSVVVYQDQYKIMTGVVENSKKMSDKLNNLIFEIIVTEKTSGSFITYQGIVETNGGEKYHISNPISVKKNTTLFIKAEGYRANVSILSKCLDGVDSYECLVNSKDNVYDYTYHVYEDMEVVLSSNISTQWKLYVVENKISNTFVPYSVSNENAYIRYSTGAEVLNTSLHLASSDYIYIANIKSLNIENLNYSNEDLAGLAFYDKNKKFVSGYQYKRDSNLTIEIPDDAIYMRFTIVIEYLNDVCITCNLIDMINTLDNNSRRIISKYSTTYTQSSYIKYTDGEQTAFSLATLSSTDFIELDGTHSLLNIENLNYSNKDSGGLAFYNENKSFISGYQYDKNSNLSIEIPTKAFYVRLTVPTNSVGNLLIYGENDLKTLLNETTLKLKKLESSIDLTDDFDYCQIFHKIVGIGDSLMSGELAFWNEEEQTNKYIDCYKYSWLSNLCKNIGAEAVHYSRGGQTTRTWLEEHLSKLKQETVLPSAYYIALGTNDSNISKLPQGLGTFDDCETDKETFYALYSKIIREVQAFNPHAKIFCCSLYYNVGSDTDRFNNAIKEMCDKYGCYYIDFFSNYAQNYNTSNHLISVGHFTSPAYVKVGRDIQNLTNEIIKNNLKDFMFVGLEHMEI